MIGIHSDWQQFFLNKNRIIFLSITEIDETNNCHINYIENTLYFVLIESLLTVWLAYLSLVSQVTLLFIPSTIRHRQELSLHTINGDKQWLYIGRGKSN